MKWVALALIASPAFADDCFDSQDVYAVLQAQGFSRSFVGLDLSGDVATEIHTNNADQWVMLLSITEGITCVVSGGPASIIYKIAKGEPA
jgi:hypothetical protein